MAGDDDEYTGKMNVYIYSFLWGTFSALSLPLGALLSFAYTFPKRWNCAFLAFGAGALLFALTIEIFGEAIFEYQSGEDANKLPMAMLAIGALLGAFVFFVSNWMIENQGGFLRKLALKNAFLRREVKKRESMRQSLKKNTLAVPKGALLQPKRHSYGSHKPIDQETSLIQDDHHLEATTPNEHQFDIDDDARREKGKLRASLLGTQSEEDLNLRREEHEIEQEFLEKKKDAQVGVAIWLGILIDAIPESLVVGILAGHGISITFIMGVFVSNFPEALSSSTIMRRGGFSAIRILLMWLSITLITGLGSVLGTFCFAGEQTAAKHLAELFVEGLAAGAMLVMIAETALPEAFRHAGNMVGFSTLLGFLAAYTIKISEN